MRLSACDWTEVSEGVVLADGAGPTSETYCSSPGKARGAGLELRWAGVLPNINILYIDGLFGGEVIQLRGGMQGGRGWLGVAGSKTVGPLRYSWVSCTKVVAPEQVSIPTLDCPAAVPAPGA